MINKCVAYSISSIKELPPRQKISLSVTMVAIGAIAVVAATLALLAFAQPQLSALQGFKILSSSGSIALEVIGGIISLLGLGIFCIRKTKQSKILTTPDVTNVPNIVNTPSAPSIPIPNTSNTSNIQIINQVNPQVNPPVVVVDFSVKLQTIKKKAFEYIDSLKIPDKNPPQEKKDYYSFSLNRSLVEYSKEELKQDFCLVEQQIKDPRLAVERMEKMLEALPYHLGLKYNNPTQYPLTGIPNYSGNYCHFNAGIQVFVHTRIADYALLRPIPIPPPVADPGPPLVKPEKKSFILPEGIDESEREHLQEEEEQKYEQLYELYQQNEAKFEDKERFDRCQLSYQEAFEHQKKILHFVENMRKGIVPTKKEVDDFLGSRNNMQGRVETLFYFSQIPDQYQIKVCQPTKEQRDFGYIHKNLLSVIICGGKNHYKVYVRAKNDSNFSHCIDDGSVYPFSPTKTGQDLIKDFEKDRSWSFEPVYLKFQVDQLEKDLFDSKKS